MAKLLHDLDHVLRHGAEAVIDVVRTRLGKRTVAIAAQIRQHDMIIFCQTRRDLVPGDMIFGIAVQQQQRRTGSAVAQSNHRSTGPHIEMLESREQSGDLGAAPAGRVKRIIRFCRNGQHRGRRLLRERRGADDAGNRGARGQRLKQVATVHAFLGLMLGHFALPGPGSCSGVRLPHFRAPGRAYGSFWHLASFRCHADLPSFRDARACAQTRNPDAWYRVSGFGLAHSALLNERPGMTGKMKPPPCRVRCYDL